MGSNFNVNIRGKHLCILPCRSSRGIGDRHLNGIVFSMSMRRSFDPLRKQLSTPLFGTERIWHGRMPVQVYRLNWRFLQTHHHRIVFNSPKPITSHWTSCFRRKDLRIFANEDLSCDCSGYKRGKHGVHPEISLLAYLLSPISSVIRCYNFRFISAALSSTSWWYYSKYIATNRTDYRYRIQKN